MPPAFAEALARTAYVWGWPMVNMLNRRTGITQAPAAGAARRRPAGGAAAGRSRCCTTTSMPGQRVGRLSEPGRGLRPRLLRSRQPAGGDRAGAGLRRPLLGLRALRSSPPHVRCRGWGSPFGWHRGRPLSGGPKGCIGKVSAAMARAVEDDWSGPLEGVVGRRSLAYRFLIAYWRRSGTSASRALLRCVEPSFPLRWSFRRRSLW